MYVKPYLSILLVCFSSCIGCGGGLGDYCRDTPHEHAGFGANPCESGLVCLGNQCHRYVGLGDSCECFIDESKTMWNQTCEGICRVGFCNRTLDEPICQELLKENEACTSSDECAESLSCNLGFETPTCQKPQPRGVKCGNGSDCAVPLTCNVGLEPPTCQGPQMKGVKCGETADCTEALTCNLAFDPPSCQPLQTEYGKCYSHSDCDQNPTQKCTGIGCVVVECDDSGCKAVNYPNRDMGSDEMSMESDMGKVEEKDVGNDQD